MINYFTVLKPQMTEKIRNTEGKRRQTQN